MPQSKSFQAYGLIRGKGSGKGIPGLQVEVVDKDFIRDDRLGLVITDEDGRFKLHPLRPDTIDTSLPAATECLPQCAILNALHKCKPFVAHIVYDLRSRSLTGSGNGLRPNATVYGHADRCLEPLRRPPRSRVHRLIEDDVIHTVGKLVALALVPIACFVNVRELFVRYAPEVLFPHCRTVEALKDGQRHAFVRGTTGVFRVIYIAAFVNQNVLQRTCEIRLHRISSSLISCLTQRQIRVLYPPIGLSGLAVYAIPYWGACQASGS